MKIADIIYELTRPETRADAGALLGQAGYKKIGATGTFGAAYARPGNPQVLKLFSPSDLGYLEFVKLCHAMQSPHLPVIRGEPVKVNDAYWGIRIERLKPIGGKFIQFIQQCRGFLGALSLIQVYRGHSAEGINRDPAIEKTQYQINSFRLKYPTVAEVLDAIYTHIISTNEDLYMNDINMYNVGMRGGTVVFFDPVGTAAHSHTPAFLELEEDDADIEPSRDELNRIRQDKIIHNDHRLRDTKVVITPGIASGYTPIG